MRILNVERNHQFPRRYRMNSIVHSSVKKSIKKAKRWLDPACHGFF